MFRVLNMMISSDTPTPNENVFEDANPNTPTLDISGWCKVAIQDRTQN